MNNYKLIQAIKGQIKNHEDYCDAKGVHRIPASEKYLLDKIRWLINAKANLK